MFNPHFEHQKLLGKIDPHVWQFNPQVSPTNITMERSTIIIGHIHYFYVPLVLHIPSEKMFKPKKIHSKYNLRRCLEL